MSIIEQGIKGEQMARELLKKWGFHNHQQIDWIVKDESDDSFFIVEVKHKEKFLSPPFDGHGLPINQIILRQQLMDKFGIKTLLLIFDTKDNHVYYQWLNELEQGKYFDTKKNIRIYNINSFNKELFNNSIV